MVKKLALTDEPKNPTGADYPFYDGRLVALSWLDWLSILVALAIGFLALTQAVPGLLDAIGKSADGGRHQAAHQELKNLLLEAELISAEI